MSPSLRRKMFSFPSLFATFANIEMHNGLSVKNQFIKWLLTFERYCFACVSRCAGIQTDVKAQTMPTNARKKTHLPLKRRADRESSATSSISSISNRTGTCELNRAILPFSMELSTLRDIFMIFRCYTKLTSIMHVRIQSKILLIIL